MPLAQPGPEICRLSENLGTLRGVPVLSPEPSAEVGTESADGGSMNQRKLQCPVQPCVEWPSNASNLFRHLTGRVHKLDRTEATVLVTLAERQRSGNPHLDWTPREPNHG